MPRRKLDEGRRAVIAAVRALVKLNDEFERIRERVAEIAKTVPLYSLRDMAVAFAVATHIEPSVSENEIDRALREGGFGIGRSTLRATLAEKARGIVTNARVRQRGGTHIRWSIVRERFVRFSVPQLSRKCERTVMVQVAGRPPA